MYKNITTILFKKNKGILISILICLLLSNIVILYAYNFLYKIFLTNTDNTYNVYTENLEFSNVKEKLEKLNKNNFHEIFLDLGNGILSPMKINNLSLHKGRKPISDNEILSNSYDIPLNTKIRIENKEFIVVGCTNFQLLYSYQYILPYEKIPKNAKIKQIILNGYMTKSKRIEKNLKTFESYKIKKPDNSQFISVFFSSQIFYIILFLMLISVLAIILNFNYIVGKSKKALAVYKFTGYNNKKLIKIIAINLIFLFLIIFIISGLIYLIIERCAINTPQNYDYIYLLNYNLCFTDYLIVDAIYLFIVLPLILVNLFKLISKKIGI